MPALSRETVRAGARGVVATLLVAALIAIGSRNLAHFDAALVGYTFATLFAVFGITYRYSMWLQRPPTALYWRRGWQAFFSRDRLLINLAAWPKRVIGVFALNNFIFRRSRPRWAAHWLIMWGCLLAGAITFPLGYDQDLPRAMAVLREAVANTPGVLTKPPNTIIVRELNDADVILEVRFWTESTRCDFLEAASEVSQAMVRALREADLRYLQWWSEYRAERKGLGAVCRMGDVF